MFRATGKGGDTMPRPGVERVLLHKCGVDKWGCMGEVATHDSCNGLFHEIHWLFHEAAITNVAEFQVI